MEEKTVRRRELRVTPEKKKRKLLVPFLAGLGVAALVPVIGSTLAANISLGSGTIEFGQGYQSTTTCDSSILVTPASTFDGEGSFDLTSVVLSGIDSTCDGKSLKLSYIHDGGATTEIDTHTYVDATDAGDYTVTVSGVASNDVTGFILESS